MSFRDFRELLLEATKVTTQQLSEKKINIHPEKLNKNGVVDGLAAE